MHKRRLTKPDGRALLLYGREPIGRPGTGAQSRKDRPRRPTHTCAGTRCAANGSPTRAIGRTARFCRRPNTTRSRRQRDPAHPTEVPAGNWDVAVFENLFPTPDAGGARSAGAGVPTAPGKGVCEVVVFTQDATASLGTLPLWHIELLIDGLGRSLRRARRAIRKSSTCSRSRTAASRSASRCIIRTARSTPIRSCRRCRRASWRSSARYYAAHGRGLLEDFVATEVARTGADAVRRPAGGGVHAGLCALLLRSLGRAAARRPVVRGARRGSERRDFARALKTVLHEVRRAVAAAVPLHPGLPPGADRRRGASRSAPARRVLSRLPDARTGLKYLAGSEIGAGVFTADTLPEEKAAELRAVEVDDRCVDVRAPSTRRRPREPDRRAHRLQRRLRAADWRCRSARASSCGRATIGRVRVCEPPDRRRCRPSYRLGAEHAHGELGRLRPGRDLVAVAARASPSAASICIWTRRAARQRRCRRAPRSKSRVLRGAARRVRPRDSTTYALARLAQRAETEFVGAPVGIMDQMACEPAADRRRAVPRHADARVRADPAAGRRSSWSSSTPASRTSTPAATTHAPARVVRGGATLLGVETLRDVGLDATCRRSTRCRRCSRRGAPGTSSPRTARARRGRGARGGDLPAPRRAVRRLARVDARRLRGLDSRSRSARRLATSSTPTSSARGLTGGGFGGAIVIAAAAGHAAAVAAKCERDLFNRTADAAPRFSFLRAPEGRRSGTILGTSGGQLCPTRPTHCTRPDLPVPSPLGFRLPASAASPHPLRTGTPRVYVEEPVFDGRS